MKRQNPSTANLSGQNGTENPLVHLTDESFVSGLTSEELSSVALGKISTVTRVSTHVLSVAKPPTTPSPVPAKAAVDFLDTFDPPKLLYSSFTHRINRRPSFDKLIHSQPDIFNIIITPYNADAFATLLDKHNLTRHYPDLVENLRHGFPLGLMPTLPSTIILRNHPTVNEYPSVVQNYINEELAAGRMSGPFTKEMTERILRGPFQSSPFIVSVQPQDQVNQINYVYAVTFPNRRNALHL